MRKNYDFTKGKRNVYAKRLKTNLRQSEPWDYINGKPIEEDPEYQQIASRLEVACEFGRAMHLAGVNSVQTAKLLGLSKARVSQILKGDENLTIGSMVTMFSALGFRIRFQIEKRTKRRTRKLSTHRR
jgi:predicted XRE-type DNA-binding protein